MWQSDNHRTKQTPGSWRASTVPDTTQWDPCLTLFFSNTEKRSKTKPIHRQTQTDLQTLSHVIYQQGATTMSWADTSKKWTQLFFRKRCGFLNLAICHSHPDIISEVTVYICAHERYSQYIKRCNIRLEWKWQWWCEELTLHTFCSQHLVISKPEISFLNITLCSFSSPQ